MGEDKSMKSSVLRGWILMVGAVALLSGCVEHRVVYVQGPPPVVAVAPSPVVSQPPPAPVKEVVVAAPGPGYVWVPGHWSWHGRWVWVRGAWVAVPRRHAVWVPGYWAQRPQGYVWIGGHWR